MSPSRSRLSRWSEERGLSADIAGPSVDRIRSAILPATLLPDRRRELAASLAALGETPPPKDMPDREHWAATIHDSAKFAAAYRWRMAWGCMLTCGLLAALFWGLGQLYPHVFLTEWAYWGGVKGIEAARWLFGAS